MDKKELLKKLTIQEKVKLTAGNNMWTCLGVEKLGLKDILLADGPHGVRIYQRRPSNEQLGEPTKLAASTMFPSAAAMASTFNEELIYEVGKTIGQECNMNDVDVLLAPGINLKRSPLGGRNFEYYSEDPYLTGRMAINFVKGVQSTGVGACIKHFALNEQENQRRFLNAVVDERTMHELYLKPFKMVIDEAKPFTIMSSYNKVNGHYASESSYLLQEVLRDRWHFDGSVISDWGAVQDKVKSLKTGMNIEMPGRSEHLDDVYDALKDNRLSEEEIDNSLYPALELYNKISKNKNKGKVVDLVLSHTTAQKVAEEAIVLLENDGILPLTKGIKLGVIGDFAKTPRINGGGSAALEPFILESPLDELEKQFDVLYGQGYEEENSNDALKTEVENIAKQVDVVLFFTGTTKNLETEGKDRPHMNLPKGHLEVFKSLKEYAKKIVVVLNNGSAVNVTPLIGKVNAIVEAWFLGGANAKPLLKVLTGEVNPSGRLSETFPIRIEHTPHFGSFPTKQDDTNYTGDIINLGYRYYDTHKYPVRYPFGYGLCYTTFTYENLKLSKTVMNEEDTLSVSLDLTNTGLIEGKEVVQVFVKDVESYVSKPEKELKAFRKVSLKPGETKQVSFALDKNAFNFYAEDFKEHRIESGQFEIMIGSNVRDIHLKGIIEVEANKPFMKKLTLQHPLKHFFIHDKERVTFLTERFHDFPWYEIEEPAIRVLKRMKKRYNVSDKEYNEIIQKLEK